VENNIKKWFRRLCSSAGIAILSVLLVVSIVLAAPGVVTDLVGMPTSTTINLRWTPAESSTSTVIRYSTTSYPATVAGGSSAYNGTGSYVEISGLTAGANYYFSAWGYDGADYGTVVNLMITTDSEVSGNNTMPFSAPALPANMADDPDSSGWDISPIDDIISYFSDPTSAHGGLGMPTDNFIMFLAGLGVAGLSLISYIKWRSFFTSWFIALILCAFCAYLGVMQWLVVPFLLIFGVGVWSVQQVAP
jgi:hypothetical protein